MSANAAREDEEVILSSGTLIAEAMQKPYGRVAQLGRQKTCKWRTLISVNRSDTHEVERPLVDICRHFAKVQLFRHEYSVLAWCALLQIKHRSSLPGSDVRQNLEVRGETRNRASDTLAIITGISAVYDMISSVLD